MRSSRIIKKLIDKIKSISKRNEKGTKREKIDKKISSKHIKFVNIILKSYNELKSREIDHVFFAVIEYSFLSTFIYAVKRKETFDIELIVLTGKGPPFS